MKYDYLVVGAGLFGTVFAREMTNMGKKCLVIDKRDHIAGNIYTEEMDGIYVHRYGAHIFHTSDKNIWEYVNQYTEFNQYINSRTSNPNSKLKNTGEYFINSQNRYGVNAILMLAIGINEAGYGNSPIAQSKNNLFGLDAVDASPGLSADTFPTVESCINDFGFAWLSGKFLQPGDYRYFGTNIGNKSVGLNIKYASDPYWAEKAASYYYDFDKSKEPKVVMKEFYYMYHLSMNLYQ